MRRPHGVSLIEVFVVVVVFALLAALAIPRFSRAAPGPDEAAALRARLKVLRVAIERYAQDHGSYPGVAAGDPTATPSAEVFLAQLTRYTDERGAVADAPDARHRFGPYLRDGIPPCPVPPGAGRAGVRIVRDGDPAAAADGTAGWIYDWSSGRIFAGCAGADAAGQPYVRY